MGSFFLERILEGATACHGYSRIRSESRLLRPGFSQGQRSDENRRSRPPARFKNPNDGFSDPAFNAPKSLKTTSLNASLEPLFRLVLAHPGFRIEGRKSLDRCLLWRTGGCPRNPCGSCRREAKTKSAPNKGKLGHLRCARQGLVRESESNTKYGGKRGKTGAKAAPVMLPSISDSRGIPKLKKTCSPSPAISAPLFTGRAHIRPPGLASARLTDANGKLLPGMPSRG
jgi:hypothetical protein